MVLASLELLLSQAATSVDRDAVADAFVTSLREKPGYRSAGAIAEGVADAAVKLGILQPCERERLLAKRAWERDPYSIRRDDCVSDLEDSITFLSTIFEKVKAYL
jgi:hypothetical protein